MQPWTITLAWLVPLLALLVVLVLWARRGMAASRELLAEIGAGRPARRETQAQSFGLRSHGPGQLRGTGYLALFDDEIVFVQAIAKNHARARLSDIVAVTTPRSFLGKTQGVELLAIEWRNGAATEQIALRVPDLDAWLAALAEAGAPVERSPGAVVAASPAP